MTNFLTAIAKEFFHAWIPQNPLEKLFYTNNKSRWYLGEKSTNWLAMGLQIVCGCIEWERITIKVWKLTSINHNFPSPEWDLPVRVEIAERKILLCSTSVQKGAPLCYEPYPIRAMIVSGALLTKTHWAIQFMCHTYIIYSFYHVRYAIKCMKPPWIFLPIFVALLVPLFSAP